MEVKHHRCQQLQSYTTHTTQLHIHTAIINQINNHKLASVPKLTQKSSIVHGAQDEHCYRPWFIAQLDKLDHGHILSVSANHARCSMIINGDALSELSKHTSMSWIHPHNRLFTSIISKSFTKTMITSHFYDRTSDVRFMSTWSCSTTRSV